MVRRSLHVFTGFLLLSVPAIFLHYYPQRLSPWLVSNITWIPYLAMVIASVISMVFYNSREFCLSLVLLVYYFLLDHFLWPVGMDDTSKLVLVNLCGILVPINFLVFSLFPERGLFNRQGLKLLSVLIFQTLLIYIFIASNLPHLTLVLISHAFIKWPTHPEFGSLMLLLNFGLLSWLLVRIYLYPGVLTNAWLFTFSAYLLSLIVVLNVLVAIIYLIISGAILIFGILLHAYHLAYRDELTQLPSRRSLKQFLLAQGKNLSIAMVDVDHFKKLNDTYGHDTGDDVLKLLASHLQKIQGGGRAFRYGGEEFTVVFPGKTAKQAHEFLDELRQRIETSGFIIRPKRRKNKDTAKKSTNNNSLTITVSIGVSDQGNNGKNTEEIMKSADLALYRAKQQGRNQVIIN